MTKATVALSALITMALAIPVGTVQAGQDTATQAAVVAEPSHSRRVQYGEDDVIWIRAKLRFTTLLVLPKDETILDYACGDREFWIINGNHNLAYCKPARAGSETNLNLVTASGNVYSFILKEISETPDAEADLKVFVEPKEGSLLDRMRSEPRYVSAEEARLYRDQAASARQDAKAASEDAERAAHSRIDSYLSGYASKLRFDYRFKAGRKPFFVTAIWNDGRFTYIRADAKEAPAFYELADGKANLVSFDYRDGVYMVQKVIDRGYLAIGKARFPFERREAK